MAGAAGTRDKGILGPTSRTLRGGPGPDLSQLKSPIQTSISGTRQVRGQIFLPKDNFPLDYSYSVKTHEYFISCHFLSNCGEGGSRVGEGK